jgi:Tfp pilus assembly protein PilN
MNAPAPANEPTIVDEVDQLKLENASLKAQTAQLQSFQKEVAQLQKDAQEAFDKLKAKYEVADGDRVQQIGDGRLAIFRAPKPE